MAALARVAKRLKSAAIGVDEASDAIRDYLDRLEADPKRLEEIEARLALIDRLKRKYGSNLDEVLAFWKMSDRRWKRSKLRAIAGPSWSRSWRSRARLIATRRGA